MKKILVFSLMVLLLAFVAVDMGFAKAKKPWKVPGNFATIQEAINSPTVAAGDVIQVGPGYFAGALLTKSVEIKGIGQTIIFTGPAHGSGMFQGFRLLAGSDGATLSNLSFNGVGLAVMNGGAVDDVTIDHCTFINTVQAISNWRGNGWVITYNNIVDLSTRNGGGIGILIGDYSGGTVENNIVAHNKISGTLFMGAGESGGYNGSGIVLYADFRYGWPGALEIKNNRVTKNSVEMISDNPDLVNFAAFEMTDTRDDETLAPVLFDNAVGFNDFRGTILQIVLTPLNLDDSNDISRNLGENRGHGLHPNIFFK